MKKLNVLFDKARHSPPPLSLREAETIIEHGAKGRANGQANWKKIILSTLILASVLLILSIFYPFSRDSKEEVSAITLEKSEEKSFQKPENNQAPNFPTDQPRSPKSAQTSPSKPGSGEKLNTTSYSNDLPPITDLSIPPYTKIAVPMQTDSTQVQQTTAPSNILEKPDSDDSAEVDSLVQSEIESLTLKDDSSSKNPVIHDSSLKVVSAPDPYEYKHFIKTDLFGHFYNVFPQELFFKTTYLDPKPLSGNRFSVGYEYLFHDRLSAGVNLSYGYAPYSQSATGEGDSTIEERYTNYSGWMLRLESRFYVGKRKPGTGLFATAYFATGIFRERTFVDRIYRERNNISSLHSTTGLSWGFGLGLGYKLPVGRFYLEPSLGFTLIGKDRNYYNWTYVGQESYPRYKALNFYEINFGFSF